MLCPALVNTNQRPSAKCFVFPARLFLPHRHLGHLLAFNERPSLVSSSASRIDHPVSPAVAANERGFRSSHVFTSPFPENTSPQPSSPWDQRSACELGPRFFFFACFQMAPEFLTLPGEIRSLIYAYLLSGPDEYIVCRTYTSAASSIRSSPSRPFRLPLSLPPPTGPVTYIHSAANLLLTNRLVRAEVQSALVQYVHFYMSMVDWMRMEANLSPSPGSTWTRSTLTLLPPWLRNGLRHVSIYPSIEAPCPADGSPFVSPAESMSTQPSTPSTTSLDGGRISSFRHSLHSRLLADSTSRNHAALLAVFPELETLDLVYFWPSILGRLKHRLELFFEGRRDRELLSLVMIAYRPDKDPDVETDVFGGEFTAAPPAELGAASPLTPRPSPVQVTVTGHFLEEWESVVLRRSAPPEDTGLDSNGITVIPVPSNVRPEERAPRRCLVRIFFPPPFFFSACQCAGVTYISSTWGHMLTT